MHAYIHACMHTYKCVCLSCSPCWKWIREGSLLRFLRRTRAGQIPALAFARFDSHCLIQFGGFLRVKSALLRFAKFSNHSQAVDGGMVLSSRHHYCNLETLISRRNNRSSIDLSTEGRLWCALIGFVNVEPRHLAAFIEISSWSILVEGEGDLIGL